VQDDRMVKQIALRLQIAYTPKAVGWRELGEAGSFIAAVMAHKDRQTLLLDAVDAALEYRGPLGSERANSFDPEAWEGLDSILSAGASAWSVGPERTSLVRRVDEAVGALTNEAVAAASPSAHDHLVTAWTAVYSRSPDPGVGYDEAVLAIEAAAGPVVLPNDRNRTLGKVLGHLKATSGEWQVSGGQPIEPLVALIDQVWTRQPRHAPGDQPTRRAQPGEAEFAVHVAAMAVHAFSRGLVTKK
jgi:hypothetical protein